MIEKYGHKFKEISMGMPYDLDRLISNIKYCGESFEAIFLAPYIYEGLIECTYKHVGFFSYTAPIALHIPTKCGIVPVFPHEGVCGVAIVKDFYINVDKEFEKVFLE